MDVVLPFALILVAFYFLILRPQRARARQAEQMQSRLAPGVEIMTTSGIYGTVTEIRDDSLMIEVSPGTTLRVTKGALGKVVADESAATDDDSDADPAPDDADPASDRDATTDLDSATDVDAENHRRGTPGE